MLMVKIFQAVTAPTRRRDPGFTIVELLIVIVVIAILAAISVVAYNGVQARARNSKISSDIAQLQRAIQAARINNDKVFSEITLSTATASNCVSKASGTDLAALPQTDACWSVYNNSLNRISVASGMDIRSLKDPYNRPYFIDENESATSCTQDDIGTYSNPFVSGWGSQNIMVDMPNYRTDC